VLVGLVESTAEIGHELVERDGAITILTATAAAAKQHNNSSMSAVHECSA
jgi:hypothetical protein